jgi:hypothetical protein
MNMTLDNAGLWYGFLSLVAGITGVLLSIRGAIVEPKSMLLFGLGVFTFCMAFVLRVIQMGHDN